MDLMAGEGYISCCEAKLILNIFASGILLRPVSPFITAFCHASGHS